MLATIPGPTIVPLTVGISALALAVSLGVCLAASRSRKRFVAKWWGLFVFACLIGAGGIYFQSHHEKARIRMIGSMHWMYDRSALESAIYRYLTDRDTWPAGGHKAVVEALLAGDGKYPYLHLERLNHLSHGKVIDPWGHPYYFRRISPDEYQILSTGPDGEEGTRDDIDQKLRR